MRSNWFLYAPSGLSMLREKSAGISSTASLDITASTPVSDRHRSRSSMFSMPPFAMMGTGTARSAKCFLIRRIISQSQLRTNWPFSSRVRPCMVSADAPAFTSVSHSLILLSKSL